jgi:outer membrane receptor protein involved in Fe transport
MRTASRSVVLFLLCAVPAWPVGLGSIRGIVHDPDHRPVPNAQVAIKAANSDFAQALTTGPDGAFETLTLPIGEYRVSVTRDGFETAEQTVVVSSREAPILHFQLVLGSAAQVVNVEDKSLTVNPEAVTPTTIVSRQEIRDTPGADLSNSMNMITDFVPGAWMTHDQLHVRGGHQVTWAIDGVPIPNTNIASNVGPQIDPKDIDYLESERGGYSAVYGDRSYGVFNVVPRTGFESNNEGEFYSTFGSFNQTNDQVNFGSHTEKFAYFASVNGNRSDYGLSTPGPDVLHDRVWGLGGMTSLIYNPNANNQLRFVTTLRGDTYRIPNDPDDQAAGIRDAEHESDAAVNFSWVHTLAPSILFTVSPFYHYNRANYDGDPADTPISTTQHRGSQYGGAQATLAAVTKKHNLVVGFYGFGQHDQELIHVVANDGSGDTVLQNNSATGQLESLFLEDQYKATSWLTLTGGVRLTHFAGSVSENAADPRLGGSIRIPYLHWTLRAFWGTYYQAPPLSTVSGPLLGYAVSQGLGFIPLRGERDQEHQFGLTIPLRGWSFDLNNYHQRAHNYFDHNNIGNSNVFFPLTVDHARLYGWELAVRSPQLFHRGEIYLAYANAHAEAAGAISGGLTDFSPPASGYFLLDHDQRHTFHTGFSWRLPYQITSSGSLYYGSGFTDGSVDYPAHLQPHTTFDFSLGKTFADRFTISVTALNLTNRRFLLDNSLTFGGTHYADPRQIYVQLRYRFHVKRI